MYKPTFLYIDGANLFVYEVNLWKHLDSLDQQHVKNYFYITIITTNNLKAKNNKQVARKEEEEETSEAGKTRIVHLVE